MEESIEIKADHSPEGMPTQGNVYNLTAAEMQEREAELLGNNFILPTLSDAHITFQLGETDGPLDALLEMIRNTKMDIMEVKLSELTEQFLNYMQTLTDLNMEQKSEFIEIAATLLEIKSRHMLPVEQDEEQEDENPEETLKRRLQMYKIFKEASGELAQIENLDHFYKEPDKSAGDFRVVLKNMNMQGLVDAFSKLLLKLDTKEQQTEEKQIRKDRFTVAESIFNMRNALSEKKRIQFTEFFTDDFTHGEIITTFLAMLELLKVQYATAIQEEIFGNIEIILREEPQNE